MFLTYRSDSRKAGFYVHFVAFISGGSAEATVFGVRDGDLGVTVS